MSPQNPLNIYKGPDSMVKFFDPDQQPPLPLVELPRKLNPFRDDNVRIYAKMLTALPAQNVKALPALNMLLRNPSAAENTIVEASSGSTVTSLGMTARVLFDNDDTHAYISNKTEMNRLRQLQFWGLKVHLYGGPAQPEFTDPRGIICHVRRLAEENENVSNPGQYDNENNWLSHVRWTGPQLWAQIPEISIFCMGMGSAGCCTGTGTYLKSQKSSVKVIGVCNAVGDPVPGPRALPLFDSCQFPWRSVVDATESVTSVDSYRLSMTLSREGVICGPSSGMCLTGLYSFLQKAKDAGTLNEYAEPDTGEIHCVFVCCDLPHQYLDGYFERLGEEAFHPIANHNLLSFDRDIYVLEWELTPAESMTLLYGPNWPSQQRQLCGKRTCRKAGLMRPFAESGVVLLDLRSADDFDAGHICGAISSPLHGLESTTSSPFEFGQTDTLYSQWSELKAKFNRESVLSGMGVEDRKVVVLCYNGETARLGTSVMRAKGMQAYSIKGGMPAVLKEVFGQ